MRIFLGTLLVLAAACGARAPSSHNKELSPKSHEFLVEIIEVFEIPGDLMNHPTDSEIRRSEEQYTYTIDCSDQGCYLQNQSELLRQDTLLVTEKFGNRFENPRRVTCETYASLSLSTPNTVSCFFETKNPLMSPSLAPDESTVIKSLMKRYRIAGTPTYTLNYDAPILLNNGRKSALVHCPTVNESCGVITSYPLPPRFQDKVRNLMNKPTFKLGIRCFNRTCETVEN